MLDIATRPAQSFRCAPPFASAALSTSGGAGDAAGPQQATWRRWPAQDFRCGPPGCRAATRDGIHYQGEYTWEELEVEFIVPPENVQAPARLGLTLGSLNDAAPALHSAGSGGGGGGSSAGSSAGSGAGTVAVIGAPARRAAATPGCAAPGCKVGCFGGGACCSADDNDIHINLETVPPFGEAELAPNEAWVTRLLDNGGTSACPACADTSSVDAAARAAAAAAATVPGSGGGAPAGGSSGSGNLSGGAAAGGSRSAATSSTCMESCSRPPAETTWESAEPGAASAWGTMDGQQQQDHTLQIRIRSMGGELVAQPSVPKCFTVRHLRHWLAERDVAGTTASRLNLLLEGDLRPVPDDCLLSELAAGDGGAALGAARVLELQLVKGNGLRVMSDEDFMKFLDASDDNDQDVVQL